MKLTNAQDMKSKSGMTLLELTVVILVLLSLISILFIGARAWKRGSDRASNILNIRNVQQAVRAHINVRGLVATDTVPSSDIIGPDRYLKEPVEPTAEIDYTHPDKTVAALIPGNLYLVAAYATTDDKAAFAPSAATTAEW